MDAYRGELEALLRDLCALPAPSSREDARVEYCRKWLENAGFSNVIVDDAKNVICRIPGENSAESVVLSAHTDTVFPDTAPFSITEKDGLWYCPGIGDDTANLAILMLTAKILLRQGRRPKYDLLFAADSCEEGLGNLKGCRTLVDGVRNRIREFISFDLSYSHLFVRAVGSSRYRISLCTEGGHSYGDFGNRNAIHQLSRIVCDFYAQPVPALPDTKTTYNVGSIQGGTSVNTVAQSAEILYEFRSDSNECLSLMEGQMHEILDRYRAEGLDLSVECIGRRPGMGKCADPTLQADLIRRAEEAIRAVVPVISVQSSASTDCNIPFSLGIPAVCFGLVSAGGAHTREEWLDPASLTDGLSIALKFAEHYFNR